MPPLEPKPPSSTLPWPYPSATSAKRNRISSAIWRIGSRVVISSVSIIGGIWIRYFNKCTVYNLDTWVQLVQSQRSSKRPLLSVSNHASCLDEPLLHGLLPLSVKVNPDLMRWTLGADDVVFRRPAHARFFSIGQTVPVIRGNGIHQIAIDFIQEKLDQLRYVHLYPEGKVNMTTEWLRFKWGVAKLIVESKTPPIVVPIWHEGFEEILPNTPPYWPQVGKRVTVVVGDPIDTEPLLKELVDEEANTDIHEDRFSDLFKPEEKGKILEMYGLEKLSAAEFTRKKLCDLLETELKKLKIQTQSYHFASA